MKIRTDITISFEVVNTLLSFLGTGKGRTVSEMKNHIPAEFNREQVQYSIDYMIEKELIIKTKHQVRGGNKLATTWIKHPSLNAQKLTKAA